MISRPFPKELKRTHLTFSLCLFAGDSSTVCSVLCQSPKVYRGVQGIWQRQGMLEDAHGTTAPCSSAPEKCPNKAHEGLGLWKRLQIQSHVQGTCGAGLFTRRVERNRLLQGTKIVTTVLGMALILWLVHFYWDRNSPYSVSCLLLWLKGLSHRAFQILFYPSGFIAVVLKVFCKELQLGSVAKLSFIHTVLSLVRLKQRENKRLVFLALAVRQEILLCCFVKSVFISDFENVIFQKNSKLYPLC